MTEWDVGYVGELPDATPNSEYTVAGQVGATANVADSPDEAGAQRVRDAWAPMVNPY